MRSDLSNLLRFVLALCSISIATAQTPDTPLVDEAILDCLNIVQDPDGHTNVRSGPSLSSEIVGRVLSGAPVFAMPESEADFHQVFLDEKDESVTCHIHGSRLIPARKWKAVASDGESGRLKHENFEAVVKDPAFVASDHKLTTDATGMVQVDGESPWGQDGGIPKRSLTLEVSINGHRVMLPDGATAHIFEPNLETLVLLTPGDPARRAVLLMTNGDGAGGYFVAWSFENGIYRGRAMMGL